MGRAWDSWPWGCEFESHILCRDYLEIKFFKKYLLISCGTSHFLLLVILTSLWSWALSHWIGLTCVTNSMLLKRWCVTSKNRLEKMSQLLLCCLLDHLRWRKSVVLSWGHASSPKWNCLWQRTEISWQQPTPNSPAMWMSHLESWSPSLSQAFWWLQLGANFLKTTSWET